MSEDIDALRTPAGASVLPDFRAVFDASPRPLLLIAADPPKYTMMAVNPAHARAFATTPEALQGWGVLEVFPTDAGADVDAFVEAIRVSFERVLASGEPNQMATRRFPVSREGREPEERFWAATNAPIKDAAGRVTHLLSAIQDVTGEVLERRSEEARELLMREVDHRARNALTVVQSFVRLSVADDVAAFRTVLDARVESLARAQTSLVARRWEGASLHDIVDGELAAISATGRYESAGPALLLPAEVVQPLSMAIHELATNAAKYGALSRDVGRLRVAWRVGDSGALALTWDESGGPPVVVPTHRGFGSRLITELGRQMGGAVEFDWRPRGLKVELVLPLRQS